jgi:hypothetical protein
VDNACFASRRRPTCTVIERKRQAATTGRRHLVCAGAEIVVCLHISSAKSNGGVEEIDSLPRITRVGSIRHNVLTSSKPFGPSSPFACAKPSQNFGFPEFTLQK